MKSWRIHFAWAIVTALVAAVSARMAAPPHVDIPSRPAAGPAAPSRHDPLSLADMAPIEDASAVGPALPSVPEPGSPAKPEPTLTERVRALMKNPKGWEELQKLVADLSQREALVAALKELLEDPDISVQFNVLTTLQLVKGPDAARMVEGYLVSHLSKEDGSASTAANALGTIGDPGSIPILRDALQSKIEETRLSSAVSLQQLGDGGPAGDLVAAMTRQYESPDGAMRKRALEVISRFQVETAVPLFARALRDSNGDVRCQAIWALSNLGKREYVPLLQPLVSDPNPEVAKEAADAVENLKSQQDP